MALRLRWLIFACRIHLLLLDALLVRTRRVQDRLIAARYCGDLDGELKGLLDE